MSRLADQNPKWLRRGYAMFERVVTREKRPVVLLEGSRDVPLEVQGRMEALAANLMRTFPELIGRSGNAEGSDQAWARGVNAVDPKRLQLVLPVPNYKSAAIETGNEVMALQEAPPQDYQTARRLTREHYAYGNHHGGHVYDRLPTFKQTYLDRDALKVLGASDYSGRRMKATVALFYINPARKNGGGTGHTLRLCEAEKVPYFLAEDWLTWPV
jgi:hypothetical protein